MNRKIFRHTAHLLCAPLLCAGLVAACAGAGQPPDMPAQNSAVGTDAGTDAGADNPASLEDLSRYFFDKQDRDRNGSVTEEEGMFAPYENWMTVFPEIDVNKDGRLTLGEYTTGYIERRTAPASAEEKTP